MTGFRIFLAALLTVVVGYTAATITNHGWNLFAVFFGDIGAMTWRGQFNLDFMGLLMLSGLWVMWRHHFSAAGIALGVGAAFGGCPFLSAYLLIVGTMTRGDVKAMLLGPNRAAR